MVEPIRWGILATGGIASTFVEDLALLDDCRVTAVASRSAQRAADFAKKYDIPHAWDSVQALAQDDDVDIVYVATPHSHHYIPTIRFLEAGKHVLCEKAFAYNADQTRTMFNVAREHQRFLMEAMWTRCNPAVREMRRAIKEGMIGDVLAVHGNFAITGDFAPSHRLRNPELAGGALLDLGVYPITMAHLVLGAPEEVHAEALMTPEGVDAYTAITLRYPNAIAQLTCSFIGGPSNAVTISGTDGRIELPDFAYRPSGYTLIRNGEAPREFEAPYVGHGYVHEALEVHRALRQGRLESTLVPPQGTVEVMEILDSVRSAIGLRYPGETHPKQQ
ncbi:Gfo/Idh/MocA family protein [Glycomyces buryatensis]|uniref:Gfo/Idh/MocA family oxidoreductase n=1 Tax=Glycomyces buryatensis TaxID=2570927 RepID=A0A4S8QEF3_9ACTN|nr:Gfo/Idh/MocA family oxidoreductase [Glycomyces buryatensis]THV42973.1 Gfo/Idh/MocA family oxidoreductase [Glycomyces buryatensis]